MLLPSEPFSVSQLVHYFPSQKYDLHTDFWPQHQITTREEDGKEVYFNRVGSFFVFLRDNCTDKYTYFPLFEPPHTDVETLNGGKVARGEIDGEIKGVKFKPIQGNAVFWVNLNKEGNGDRRVVHTGLPVAEEEKIGLNVWPRKYFGLVGDDDGSEKKDKKVDKEDWNGKWKE